MTELRTGTVVVTQGERDSVISRAVEHATRSPWTHAFIVTAEDQGVEAWFPRVRRMRVGQRLEELDRVGRAWVTLALPGLAEGRRALLARKAESYVGRWYDVGQALLYLTTRQFRGDGEGTLVCSRLVTAAHLSGIGENLFDASIIDRHYPTGHPRRRNLESGYATPADLMLSRLQPVSAAILQNQPVIA